MACPPLDDERSRSKKSEDSAFLPSTTFDGHSLTRAKKLRSPVRSNESSASMPTPIQALVVDLENETATYAHYEDENDADDADDDDNDDDEDEGEISSSGSSTPKASRQSFGAYGGASPPPTYVTTTTAAGSGWQVERSSTPRASRQTEQNSYSLSPTLPARAYSPPGENLYAHRRHHDHGRNESISSMTTIKPGKSEQEVLEAMIDDLSRNQPDGPDGDDVLHERGLELKPVRSLRRERR